MEIVIRGTAPKEVLVRGLGPSLSKAGVSNAVSNPSLELYSGSGEEIAKNDDWEQDESAQHIGELGLEPSDKRESAMIRTLEPGTYTAVLRGVGNTTGTASVDVYDLDDTAAAKIVTAATRGSIRTRGDEVIGGFIALGSNPVKLLLRAIGPSLVNAGITDALPDPIMRLYDGNGTLIDSNDDWQAGQASEIETSGLAPNDHHESAMVRELPPGSYTATVRGKNGETGVCLFEAYQIDD